MLKIEPEERQLLQVLLVDYQIDCLRKLNRAGKDTNEVRRLRKELRLSQSASLKVGYVPPKA